MFFGRAWRWITRRTLGGRLVAGVVALLAVACATVGVTTYLAVRTSEYGELNAQLQAATTLWNTCVAQTQTGGNLFCNGLNEGTFGAVVSQGAVQQDQIIGQSCDLSVTDANTLARLRVGPPVTSPGSDPVYVRNLPSIGGDYLLTAADMGGGNVLITGLPMGTTESALEHVKVAEVIVFAAVLLLTGVLGTGWVRLSLRPLRRVAATAAEVAELPLESGDVELPEGVPDADPRTEVGQVGAVFNRMLGHVQAALTRREASEARLRRFAADASHELRTPLSSIRGYAELALRQPSGAPEPVVHALRRVESESARMSMLVDDLLLLARLDAGRPLAEEPVDLSRLAIDATSDARVARPGHRWMLDLPGEPVTVCGDPYRLQQVLANLLSNAGRHTPEGSTVTVRIASAPATARSANAGPATTGPTSARSASTRPASTGSASTGSASTGPAVVVRRSDLPPGPRVELSVTDDGPGIPTGMAPELFERFTRGDTARTHTDDGASTGLGLAIVDAVVAAHHGAIIVTSRPGMTRFNIILPATPS
jgi:two-component system, OmpR family, sensor kinase